MIRKLIPASVATLTILAVLLPNLAAAATTSESASNVRDATAGFNDPAAALAAGYDLLTDAADIACIDQPGSGAMAFTTSRVLLFRLERLTPHALRRWSTSGRHRDGSSWRLSNTSRSRPGGTLPMTHRRRCLGRNSC